MHTRIASMIALATLALASCGDSLDVDNVNPRGSVGGLVYDAVTRAPLEGATVTLVAGGEMFDEVVTDATGAFTFERVPAGEVIVNFAGPEEGGYQSAWIRDELPAAAGEFPLGNSTITLGPVGLVPLTGTFTVRVLDLEGSPVSNYNVVVRTFVQWVDLSSGIAVNRGETLSTIATDTNGYAQISGLPDFFALGPGVNDSLLFLLPPLDQDMDGFYEYPGGNQTYAARAFGDATPDIILDPAFSTQLQMRASTVSSMVTGGTNPVATVVGISDTLHFSFNLPISGDSTATVVDEQGTPLDPQPAISVRDDNMTVAFGSSPLMPGGEYNIHIHAISAVGEVLVSGDFVGSFFTRAISPDVVVDSITRDPGTQLVEITFNQPIGGVTTSLSGGNCVLYFAANLGGDIAIGDFNGELGSGTCTAMPAFNRAEPALGGLFGNSGYSSVWTFVAPNGGNGLPLLSNTRVHVLFSNVVSTNAIMERPDGTVVPDFTDSVTMSIPLP